MRYTQGNNKVYFKGTEAKADVQLRFNGGIRIDEDTEDMMNALASLVKLKLYEELREKRGGVYGVECLVLLQKFHMSGTDKVLSLLVIPVM